MTSWDAPDYHVHSVEQLRWARELITKLRLRGDERLLDLGCGDGKVTVEIARMLPSGVVIGLDSSPSMIAFARSIYPTRCFPNLSFVEGDMTDLGFENTFDVVFSNAALHWVTDHGTVLEGIARCLVPGGRCLLQMGGRGNAGAVLAIAGELIGEERWRKFFDGFESPYAFYGSEDYGLWLKNAGLNPRRVELIPKDMVHEGREGFAGWLRTTWHPYLDRVPEHDRQEFLDEIIDRYVADHPPDATGRIHLDMVRLEVEAKK